MIANKLPQGMKGEGPFRERFIRLQFSTHIEDLEEERVIATLWGCVKRRLNQIEANVDSAKGINLHYNQDPVYLKILTENKHKPFVAVLETNNYRDNKYLMHALKIGEKDSDRNPNYMSIIGENDSNPLLSERPIDDTVLMLNLLPDKLF